MNSVPSVVHYLALSPMEDQRQRGAEVGVLALQFAVEAKLDKILGSRLKLHEASGC